MKIVYFLVTAYHMIFYNNRVVYRVPYLRPVVLKEIYISQVSMKSQPLRVMRDLDALGYYVFDHALIYFIQYPKTYIRTQHQIYRYHYSAPHSGFTSFSTSPSSFSFSVAQFTMLGISPGVLLCLIADCSA